MTTEFVDIWHTEEHGRLRIGATGISWKVLEGDKRVNVPASELKWAEWTRVARNYQLRIGLKDTWKRESFEGFRREDQDTLTSLLKQNFDINLEVRELSWRGWNWGSTDFRGQDLVFLIGNKPAFDIPLPTVANSNIAGKTEVSLEFIQPDVKRSAKNAPDELMELRMYIPGTQQKDDGDEGDEQSAAQVFHETIKEKADIGQVTGESIVVFHEVLVTTPRGRYDIHMFPNFLRLHGKTYDYKVPYNTISRLFLLPRADEQNISLVVNLDPPIRQGQTRYPFLVLVFNRDEQMAAELNIDEETLQTKYEGRLDKSHDGLAYQIIANVYRSLVGKNIARPSSAFAPQSHDPGHPIKCNLKAVQGELYFLEKSIFFLSKQPYLINISDVYEIVLTRIGGGLASGKTIDLRIEPKGGSEVTFSSIDKGEKDHIEDFLTSKGVRVKTEAADEAMAVDLGSDDDEDMESDRSVEEDVPKPRAPGGGGDDEDSSEDEDFQASTSDEGSPTSSSDDSEEGSDASDSPVKKKKKRDNSASPSPKKSKSDGTKPKPKPKPKVSADKDDSDGEGPAKKKKRVD
ncbi:FACT complex subunit pob3 AltName: Full=Facilitates chromatin transcription complex subunit pob3 [Serendipita indica DSM 11827]|nr:FACT complex subunit pob3 AltName: Full=Facilitates chromatin transcription complex subunit pob3 [Serendipita indica DSM 11827]